MPARKIKVIFGVCISFLVLFVVATPIFAALTSVQAPQSPLNQRDRYTTDMFTGTANFSYPIKVPKGTNDLTPEVNISYNSSGARDLKSFLGMGWILNQDYIERDVNFTPNNTGDDKFKLHFKGAVHDLIYVSSEGLYHTKRESYLKIQKLTGGSNDQSEYWVVTAPDGTKYRFGYQSQSELVCNGRSYINSWNVDLVTDTNDNKMYYTYTEDNGISYLSKIEYNNDQSRKVEFSYTTNPYERPAYSQGCYAYDLKRLTNVQVKIGTTLVREYTTAFSSGAGNTQPLLDSITEKGDDSSTYLTTTFEYKPQVKGWNPTPETWLNHANVDVHLGQPNVVMSDVNADGRLDIVKTDYHGGPSVTWKVLFNRGDHWDNGWNIWVNHAPIEEARLDRSDTQLVDVNGDNLPDIVKASGASTWWVFKNNGSGWNTSYEAWGNISSYSGAHLGGTGNDAAQLVDMTGDGLPDIVNTWWNGAMEYRIFRNTGSGWSGTPEVWSNGGPPTGIDSDQVKLLDVNGDGLPDVVKTSFSGPLSTWQVWKNTGSGFSSQTTWLNDYVNAHFQSTESTVADANGDGLIDIIRNEDFGTADRWKVLYNKGGSFMNTWDNWIETTDNVDIDIHNNTTKMADIDGDGLTDIVNGVDDCSCGYNTFKVYKNKGTSPYLLAKIYTERGAIISYDYKPSTIYDNTGPDDRWDLSFPMWVVQKMTLNNGLTNSQGTTDVTTYSYTDGSYNTLLKEFQGFGTVDTVEPNGSKKKYVFNQTEALTGKLIEVQHRDSSNNPYAETENTWTSSTTNGVITAKQTEEKNYTYDGTASNPKITQTNFEYDSYGNITKKSDLGDTSVSGDERFTYNEYTYNTTDWIVNTLKKTTQKAANDSTKVGETSFYYDNHSNINDAPSKGDLTKEVAWSDGIFTTDPTTTYAYDSFGNQTSVTDANNHTTTTAYDTTGTYPTSTTNAKSQTTSTSYDLGTGNLLSKTDPNGQTTTYVYDHYGRITKEIKPYDSSTYPSVQYTYYTDGVDGTKIAKREVSSQSATLDTYTWVDGLARTISTRTDAEDSGKQIVVNNFYDSTGQVTKTTVPHEDNSYDYYRDPLTGIKNTETLYDAIGRPTVINNPKGDAKTIAYDHWKETTVDENGHIKREFKNAYDKIAKVEEVNNASTYTTTYTYDTRDLLTKITDDANNDITFTYNSLGRKISQVDPDMGTWTYEYDSVGNLKKQTDNRGIIVTKNYDELDRLTKTDYPNDTDATYLYDAGKIGALSIATDAAGTVSYQYDNRLRKTQEQRSINGTTKTTAWTYDGADRTTTQTNPDSEVITYEHNPQGEIESVSNVLSNINYNALGKITSKTFANGLTTNYTYNTNDFRLNRIQTGSLQDLNYTYDNVGNVKSINDAIASKTKNYTYDDLDRLKTATDSAGLNQAYEYNSIGNLTKATDNGIETTYGYGANGKVHAMTSSSEKVAPPAVSPSGTPLTSTLVDDWATGSIRANKWNNWGGANVTVDTGELKMQSSLGGGYYGIDSGVDSRIYNLTNSSIINKLVDAGNQSIGSWEVYPIYAYINGDSSTQYFFYISENTLRAYKKVSGSNTVLASASYNSTNHKWFRIREAGGTTYFDTSANGQTWNNFTSTANAFSVTSMVVGTEVGTWSSESATTSARFDNFNYATPSTSSITDDWATGSINSSKWGNWGGSQVAVTDEKLNMTSTTGGGYYGVDSGSNVFNLTNSYIVNQLLDAGNQSLSSWEVYPIYAYVQGDSSTQYFFYISENTLRAYKKVGGSNTVLASTTYNATNHKWFRIREANGTTYFDTSADGATWNNLASTANAFAVTSLVVGTEVGSWNSEASTTTAIFDNFNVWHPIYTYDANGNMTSDGFKCYEFNESNQLSKAKECGSNLTIAEYIYDYNGNRMVKKNYLSGTHTNTVTSWSDSFETKAIVGGATQNTSYYFVNGELLSKKDKDGNRTYMHNDHLGSISLVTNSSGAKVEETEYDPWGKVQSGGTTSKFLYTGQEKDAETGLNYYNARYYDSHTRHFTQADDLIQNVYDPQSLNRYAYVRNNPLRYTDPSGHALFPALGNWIASYVKSLLKPILPQPKQPAKTQVNNTTKPTNTSTPTKTSSHAPSTPAAPVVYNAVANKVSNSWNNGNIDLGGSGGKNGLGGGVGALVNRDGFTPYVSGGLVSGFGAAALLSDEKPKENDNTLNGQTTIPVPGFYGFGPSFNVSYPFENRFVALSEGKVTYGPGFGKGSSVTINHTFNTYKWSQIMNYGK